MQQGKEISRRQFIKKSLVVAGGIALPTIVPSSVFGADAPSNRITMGCIGMGNQGFNDMKGFMYNNEDVRIVAVCDVNTASYGYKRPSQYCGREPARKTVDRYYAQKSRSGKYNGCDAYNDFREILARDDIDTVLIVTPDHWHAIIAIMAAQAGKDIYCEKPLALTVQQGRAMVEAVRQHNVIFQTGSHERSNPRTRFACELVRNGRIGELKRITTTVRPNNKTAPSGAWEPTPVPEGFDYDMWLGPAPWQPHHKDRCFYTFRFILDYSGGQVTNFGAHSNDIAQWGNGTELTGPVEVEDMGSVFPRDGLFNTATKVAFRARYANSVELICKTQTPLRFAVRFEGTEGWVDAAWGNYDTYPRSLSESVIRPEETHLYKSNNHYRNFLDCVKTRKDPVAPVEIGHRSATLCHIGNIAMMLKRKLRWNPDKEQFINDDEANDMLSKPMRSPWHL